MQTGKLQILSPFNIAMKTGRYVFSYFTLLIEIRAYVRRRADGITSFTAADLSLKTSRQQFNIESEMCDYPN